MDYEKCGDNFNSEDQVTKENLNVKNYYCFKNNYFSIAGSYFSPIFHYIEVRMSKWKASGTVTCKTDAQINTALDGADVKMAITNSVVDLVDYNMPVKYYIDDSFYWQTMPGFRKKADMELSKNVGNFIDNLLQITSVPSEYFYQVKPGKENIILTNTDGEFMTIYLRTDEQYDQYDRKVYSIGDLLGQLGGFFEVLHAAGWFLTFMITERLATAALASTIFQISGPNKGSDSGSSNGKKNDNLSKSSSDLTILKINTKTKEPVENGPNVCPTLERFNYDEDCSQFSTLKREIINRKRFFYNWKNLLCYVWSLGWIRKKLKKYNENPSPLLESQKYYNLAADRIKHELDVCEILMNMRAMKAIIQILLRKDQRVLLDLQKLNCLSEDTKPGGNKVLNDTRETSQPDAYCGTTLLDHLNSPSDKNANKASKYLNEVLYNIDPKMQIDKRLWALLFEKNIPDNLNDYYNFDKGNVVNPDDLENSNCSAISPCQGKINIIILFRSWTAHSSFKWFDQ